MHIAFNYYKGLTQEEELYLNYIYRKAKAKSRGWRRVERNYAKLCAKYGFKKFVPYNER